MIGQMPVDELGRQAGAALERTVAVLAPPSLPTLRQRLRRRRQRHLAVGAVGVLVVSIMVVSGLLRPWDPSVVVDRPPADDEPAPEVTAGSGATDCPSREPGTFEGVPAEWTALTPPPHHRVRAAAVWTGDRLLVVGGESGHGGLQHASVSVYDPAVNAWTCGTEAPFQLVDGRVEWSGDMLYAWGDSAAATYDPRSDRWQALPVPPDGLSRDPLAVAWTGTELIVWGTTSRNTPSPSGAAYDPAARSWRVLPDAPVAINQGQGVWTGTELLVYGAQLNGDNLSTTSMSVGAAYDPTTDSWRELAPFDLSPQAASIAWLGGELLAWDYGLGAGLYDPFTDTWIRLPHLPLGQSECYPQSAVLEDGRVLAWFCSQAALFDPDLRTWTEVETAIGGRSGRAPTGEEVRQIGGRPVASGNAVYFVGNDDALWRWQASP